MVVNFRSYMYIFCFSDLLSVYFGEEILWFLCSFQF